MATNVFKNHFDSYAINGEKITGNYNGIELIATLVRDEESTPDDKGCYSEDQAQAWRDDDWFFAGLVVTATVCGRAIDIGSVWGFEINILGDELNPNKYLTEEANNIFENGKSDFIKYLKGMKAELEKSISAFDAQEGK